MFLEAFVLPLPLLWAVSLSESLRDRNHSEILQSPFRFSCSLQDCKAFSLERGLDLEKHLYPRKFESCCLPHSTSWGWLISAGSGGAGQRNAQERAGTDGAILAGARPAPGSENSTDRGVEQCKAPCSTSGSGCSVLMCSGLCHCGSVTLQLLFLLTSCWHSIGSMREGQGHGKGAFPYSLPEK